MHRRLAVVVSLALAAVVLASCSSGKDSASPPTSLLFQTTTSSTLPDTPVVARVLSPEKGSVQGRGGLGLVVALVFTAKDPSALPADFHIGGQLPAPATAVKPGRNPAFPGLVVTLNTTSTAVGGASTNLANLFQIVSPAVQPDGSMQVTAIWTNAQAGFGTDVDATLVAFTVPPPAPETVPDATAALTPNSNTAQVTFHLAGGDESPAVAAASNASTTTSPKATTTTARGATTTTTAKPSTTTAAPTTTRAPTTTTAVPATTTTTRFLGLFGSP
jgi:hypothetical protein